MNRQSNLIIYMEFVYINFIVFNYFCVCICLYLRIFLFLFVCKFALLVTSLLPVFVLYLFWLCFSSTICVIHCFYPLKNPCKRKESLLGILSLVSQTSFNCNLKSKIGSLSYTLLFLISSHF